MSQEETLYIKIDQNILVHDYHVTLGDIAKLESSDKSMVRQLKQKRSTRLKSRMEIKEQKADTGDFHHEGDRVDP